MALEDPKESPMISLANGDFQYADLPDVTVEQLLLQGIGRALGLDSDGSDPHSIMYPFLTAQNRTLDSDDIAGIQALYGPPTAPAILDTTTGQPISAASQPYTGPVAGLLHEYINITSDSLNISATTDNWFIHSGSGTDGITVHGGINVVDGGTGSNFLIGGTGRDTFYMDNRNPTAPIFSTIVNFHAGDDATVWGVNTTDFKMLMLDNQGAAGAKGLDLLFAAPGKTDTSFVLAGYTSADLVNGRLSISSGKTQDLPGLPGSQFVTVHAN